MSMPIEEDLSQTNLEVLSNFLIKFREAKENEDLQSYVLQYSGAKNGATGIVNFDFVYRMTDASNTNYRGIQPVYRCQLTLNDTNGAISWENFDYQTKISSCQSWSAVTIYKSRSEGINYNSNYYTYAASDVWEDNYLDYLHYNTLEVQPSPSTEPEEPSGDTTGNTTFLILISAILMLLVMYRFIGSLFSRGD